MKVFIDWLFGLFDLPPINWITESWNGIDKLGHFLIHASVGFVYALFGAWLGGVACSLLCGFVWEMYDSARGVGASWKDLCYNCLGLFGGLVIGAILRGGGQ